jgi:hypothetical protein
VQYHVYVLIIFGATLLFRLLCGVMALWFARKDPKRDEQLFNVFLELFRLGWAHPLVSIRRQGAAGHKDRERLALPPQMHVRPDDNLNILTKRDEV